MNVESKNFKEEVLSEKIPVLVDFWAEWCFPCKMIAPYVEEIEKEYANKIKVVSVNVDENQDIAANYGIMSIPTLGFFVNGEMVDQIVGAVPKKVIEKKIEEILNR